MDLEAIMLRKIIQGQIQYGFTYMQKLKGKTNLQNKTKKKTYKYRQTSDCHGGRMVEICERDKGTNFFIDKQTQI